MNEIQKPFKLKRERERDVKERQGIVGILIWEGSLGGI